MTCAYEDPNCEIGLIVGKSETCFTFCWGAYSHNRSCFQPCQTFLFILMILLYILTDLTFTFLNSEAFPEAVACFPVLSINSPRKRDFSPICEFTKLMRVDLDKGVARMCEWLWPTFSYVGDKLFDLVFLPIPLSFVSSFIPHFLFPFLFNCCYPFSWPHLFIFYLLFVLESSVCAVWERGTCVYERECYSLT